ncbi:Na/Pi-cotransporter II-related protein [Tepidanaerobacter acetatoxydans Re1]|uniref:Na/Pi-cotransporter II-related protein n=1 Tax=Tepidanaerobacter acetatoxydans (strain DSM 21804 / JCM 16047 / Re1) TaxID=1209989 RepID=F4LWB5_TEPAE|nr:Na/Pi cotransporter family protein [Tepidanaerobacter acetatoxydans]AEE91713.1 Na/Pi-cotransporter II-related protein [Tepidanaerobacter acetatoxydans Re1]CCP26478.1 Na/Pi-cotransporter II-related protein [Tepidanaerobacter acetatoxydans Re1]
MSLNSFFTLLGGLGLFIYGMRLMGDGLEMAAGERLKGLLELLTRNRLLGVLVGTLVTAIIQSSSATTVMVVGLVNAGIMDFSQAIGIIMGANIGTTMTAQLIAFKLTNLALPAIGIGTGIFLFGRNKSQKYLGQVILGFGLLFFGMQTMEIALKPLAQIPEFTKFIASFSKNPFLGVLAGFLTTGIVQSSSATIGILQALAGQGIVNISSALPILFGDNIGTCVTALLSSIGTNITARRTALFHLIFNIVGTIIFMLLLPLVQTAVALTSPDPVRQIANAHTIFNVANTIIQLPFAFLIMKLVIHLVPGEPEIIERGLKYIDDRLLETPSIALAQVKKEIARMGNLALETLRDSINTFLYYDEQKNKIAKEKETVINDLAREITRYLALLSRTSLPDDEHVSITDLVSTVNDMERVGDHAMNILELAEFRNEHRLPFSNEAIQELVEMSSKVTETFDLAVYTFLHWDKPSAQKIVKNEEEIDNMENKLRLNHIKRLSGGLCDPSSGVIFLDLLTNLERVGDHSFNIASYVLKIDKNYKRL